MKDYLQYTSIHGAMGNNVFAPIPWKYNNIRGRYEKIRTEPKINRNEPCSCGSGLKYKHCCQ